MKKRIILMALATIMTLCLLPSIAFAVQDISGSITENVAYDGSNDPHDRACLTGDTTIGPGVTITLTNGADINLNGYRLNNYGTISGGNINYNNGGNVYNYGVMPTTEKNQCFDLTLSSLALSNGTLYPSFAAGTRDYTVTVESKVSSITVTPTLNTGKGVASLTVNGVAATSGSASTVSLEYGPNVIPIVITASDTADTTNTYNLTVTRTPDRTISIDTQPAASTTVTAGSISGSLSTSATVTNSGTPVYNWYACDSTGTLSGNSLGTGASFTIPTSLTAGTYYYICRVTAEGAVPVNSSVAMVTVNSAAVTAYALTVTPDGKDFGSKMVNYSAISPEAFTVTSAGTGALSNLAVTLDGTNASSFTLDTTGTATSLDAAGGTTTTTTFTVKPNDSLPAGTYTANIKVNADGINEIVKTVSFTVNPQPSSGSSTDYYTLTFDTNGGSSISSIRPSEYTTVDLSKYTPTRTGYTFTGWYSDKELTTKITSVRLTKNTSVYAGWSWNNPFADVKDGDWFYDGVKYAKQNGLFAGTSDTTFSPNASMTRQMLWTVLARLDGQTLPKDGEFAAAKAWAMEKKLTDGTNPTDSITREQLAAMLYRYAQSVGKGFAGEWMFLLDMTDRASISDWAYEAVCWMNMNGVIEGKNGKVFDPQGDATRAQVATMLVRFRQAMNG